MIRPKKETEDLLLSIAKNCEILIKQTHRKPQETLEFKMRKPGETFHFNPPIQSKVDWMLGLTDLEVYNSIFIINTTNNKIELLTDIFDEFSFEKLKDEVEEILNIPYITDAHLKDETIGPRIFKAYWELRSKKSSTDGFFVLLRGFARSPFRAFRRYLRIIAGLDEVDIRLILKQYNANFLTCELYSGDNTIEDLQEAVYLLGDHEGPLKIECDDFNKKTKLF